MPKTLLWFSLLAAAGAPSPARAQGAASPTPTWLVADSAARTVRLTLGVGHPDGAPAALINGRREGAIQVVVPLGWTVTWEWRSADSTAPHSLVLMAEREKLPTE